MLINLQVLTSDEIKALTINPNRKTIQDKSIQELAPFLHSKIVQSKISPGLKKEQLRFMGPCSFNGLYVWIVHYEVPKPQSVKTIAPLKYEVHADKPILIIAQKQEVLNLENGEEITPEFVSQLMQAHVLECDQSRHYEEEPYDYES